MLSGLATWVQDVIESLGYLGVAILVIVENLFPPIPSEIVLPFAGFVAQRGDASVVVMILAATIGSVVGALILYYISSAIGPDRLRLFVVRFGKWFGVKESDLTRAEEWFDRRSNNGGARWPLCATYSIYRLDPRRLSTHEDCVICSLHIYRQRGVEHCVDRCRSHTWRQLGCSW